MSGRLPGWTSLVTAKSIAVVGASDRPGPLNFARRMARNNAIVGYRGVTHYVNPRYREVLGQPCFPSLTAIDDDVDVCVVNVPGSLVLDVVREGTERGVTIFVIHSGDFAEAGPEGQARQEALAGVCRTKGVTLFGPNCLGVFHSGGPVALYGADMPGDYRAGGIAMLSGSGSVTTQLARLGSEIGLHSLFSMGNEAVTTSEDVLEQLVEDPDVRVVAMFLEALRQPEKFREVVYRAHLTDTPVIVLKSGLSLRGAQAARSHTGAVVGSGNSYRAFFEQLGVVQVNDFDELRQTARLMTAVSRPSPGTRDGVAVVGISGGKAGVIADVSTEIGLRLSDFDEDTSTAIAATLALPAGEHVSNPIDVGAGFRNGRTLAENVTAVLRNVASDADTALVFASQHATTDATDGIGPVDRAVLDALLAASGDVRQQIVIGSDISGRLDPDLVAQAVDAGAVVLCGLRESLVALKGWQRWSRGATLSPGRSVDEERVRSVSARLQGASGLLPPTDTWWILEQYGIPAVRSTMIRDAADAAGIGLRPPLVAKVVSRHVVHKSDVGGVILGIEDETALAQAHDDIHARLAVTAPDAQIDGVQVSEMVAGDSELFLGAMIEPGIGPVVAVGLGGVMVELMPPPSLAVAPFDLETAQRCLRGMPGAAVLNGFRGRPTADVQQLATTICALGDLVWELQSVIASVDLNPIVIHSAHPGGLVLDARITLSEERKRR